MIDNTTAAPKPLRRHLMDMNSPPPPRTGRGTSVTQVQRWVLTILAITVGGHFAAGLMIAAIVVGDDKLSPRIGLNVMATISSILLVAAVRAIHKKSLLSPWLALGLIAGGLGFFLTFFVQW